ncbi:MAG: hypothetical protein RL091_600, partial [Verrucomicrobiota bacterium]
QEMILTMTPGLTPVLLVAPKPKGRRRMVALQTE